MFIFFPFVNSVTVCVQIFSLIRLGLGRLGGPSTCHLPVCLSAWGSKAKVREH